jgi:hypothetical protein
MKELEWGRPVDLKGWQMRQMHSMALRLKDHFHPAIGQRVRFHMIES